MSLVKRKINVTFQLGTAATTMFAGGNDTALLTGLRCSATVNQTGGPSMTELQLTVYGMTPSQMNALSTLGRPVYTIGQPGDASPRSIVTVEAGDDAGMASVFAGSILQAYADGAGAPKFAFRVVAQSGGLDQNRVLSPTSYSGTVSAATILAGLAEQMGRGFEPNGVTATLSNPYYSGSGRKQVTDICRHAGLEFAFEGEVGNGENEADDPFRGAILAVWPADQVRGTTSTVISPSTGLVGYPSWTANGIALTTLFNPTITYRASLQVQSSIPQACGTWAPYKVGHELESETPDGAWFTHLECANFDKKTASPAA